MPVVVLKDKITRENIIQARKEYNTFIKITIDLDLELVAIGGQYHADAQNILIKEYGSKSNIWGGGYSISRKQFETNALINFQPDKNPSMEIVDPQIRERFLQIAKRALVDIEKFI